MTKLSDYYKMIAEIDGRPLKEDPRVTYFDFDFKEGKGKEGSATITYFEGKPVHLNWYIWDLDRTWMMEQVNAKLGGIAILCNFSGGNGHEGADIQEVVPAEPV